MYAEFEKWQLSCLNDTQLFLTQYRLYTYIMTFFLPKYLIIIKISARRNLYCMSSSWEQSAVFKNTKTNYRNFQIMFHFHLLPYMITEMEI